MQRNSNDLVTRERIGDAECDQRLAAWLNSPSPVSSLWGRESWLPPCVRSRKKPVHKSYCGSERKAELDPLPRIRRHKCHLGRDAPVRLLGNVSSLMGFQNKIPKKCMSVNWCIVTNYPFSKLERVIMLATTNHFHYCRYYQRT